jgi:hypothetical protein
MTEGNICYFCGLVDTAKNKGFRKLVEYHHIIERHLGGSNEYSNLVPCCSTCHSKVHLGMILIDTWYDFGYMWKLKWTDVVSNKVYFGRLDFKQ